MDSYLVDLLVILFSKENRWESSLDRSLNLVYYLAESLASSKSKPMDFGYQIVKVSHYVVNLELR